MLIPPLKAPLKHDVKACLSSWLDETSNECSFVSQQIQPELDSLVSLRNRLVKAGTSHDQAGQELDYFQEYHAVLLEFEGQKFPSIQSQSSIKFIRFPWQAAISKETEVQSHFEWERANVLWNIASLLAYEASLQDKGDRHGWNQAHILLQEAASVMHYLRELGEASNDFTSLSFWESFLLAQAQVATYYMALAAPKPRHAVLAKLASAAVPLLDAAYEECSSSQVEWQAHCNAWNTWMLALSQYHESCVHKQKKQWAMELARLGRAREAIACCQECVYQSPPVEGLEILQGEVPKMVRAVRDRLLEARRNFSGSTDDVTSADIREIRGELLVKSSSQLPKQAMKTKTPLFTQVRSAASVASSSVLHPKSRSIILKFQQQLDGMVRELASVGEDKMEEARVTLASFNLPHSLNAYKQEQRNSEDGGIPLELWARIEALQDEETIKQLKQDLWELRDLADSALSIHHTISKQLDEDADEDRRFRENNPQFEGHVVSEVQESFRLTLNNYESLLSKSREGDSVLSRRLESLDTDPKYQLLHFQKPQLDRLMPGGGSSGVHVDISQLARLLVALSSLFDEREELLEKLKSEARNYDVIGKMAAVDPNSPTASREYERVAQMSLKSFGGIAYEIRLNITRQVELVESILAENEAFMAARDARPPASANENCIAMIEDALEEAEQLNKHLQEGRDFYRIVLPKLEHLAEEVGEASVRLAIERCEFEDRALSRHQESVDARLAASMSGANGSSLPRRDSGLNNNNSGRVGVDVTAQQQPPLTESLSQHYNEFDSDGGGGGGVQVDDAKVAHLIGMDFDPEKVVAALKKHNNNMDQALNELLC